MTKTTEQAPRITAPTWFVVLCAILGVTALVTGQDWIGWAAIICGAIILGSAVRFWVKTR